MTTIATPHRWSEVADAVLGLLKYLPANEVDVITDAVLSLVQEAAHSGFNGAGDVDRRKGSGLRLRTTPRRCFNGAGDEDRRKGARSTDRPRCTGST